MFSREFAFCLFINYAHMIMHMDARAYDQIWKKNVLCGTITWSDETRYSLIW